MSFFCLEVLTDVDLASLVPPEVIRDAPVIEIHPIVEE